MLHSASQPSSSIVASRARGVGLIWWLFGLHLLAQPLYALLPAQLELPGTLLVLGSSTVFAFAHLWAMRGLRAALVLLVLCLGIAGGFEVLSVQTGFPFGHYTYLGAGGSSKLGLALWGVPLLVPFCWQMMAWNAFNLAERLSARWTVPLAALALTAWDVFVDPQMVRQGYWFWARQGEYVGIPLENYAGWFLTALLIFLAFRAFVPSAGAQPDVGVFALLPVFSYAFTWFGSSIVNWFWWQQATVGWVGFVCMGVFALPALLKVWGKRA